MEIDGEIYTLEQALAQFTSSETLGGDDKYKCNRYLKSSVILQINNHESSQKFYSLRLPLMCPTLTRYGF